MRSRQSLGSVSSNALCCCRNGSARGKAPRVSSFTASRGCWMADVALATSNESIMQENELHFEYSVGFCDNRGISRWLRDANMARRD
jgi:hypothetical protein